MSGLKFRISPDAFFQVNTKAAEKLFDVITELCSSPNVPPVIYGKHHLMSKEQLHFTKQVH